MCQYNTDRCRYGCGYGNDDDCYGHDVGPVDNQPPAHVLRHMEVVFLISWAVYKR